MVSPGLHRARLSTQTGYDSPITRPDMRGFVLGGPAAAVTGVVARGPHGLPRRPLEVTWHRPHEAGYAAGAVDIAADAGNNIYACVCAPVIGRPPVSQRLTVWQNRRPGAALAAVGLRSACAHLARHAGLTDRFGRPLEADRFTSIDADADGDVVMGVELAGVPHPAFLAYRARGDRFDVIAGPADVAQLLGLGARTGSVAVLRPAPRSRGAWLVVAPRAYGDDARSRSLPVRAAVLSPDNRGAWSGRPITPRWPPGRADLLPAMLLRGAPATDGAWVFPSPGGLWRLGRDGSVGKLADLPIPEHDVRVLPPAVTADGSVWIALNRVVSSGAGRHHSQQDRGSNALDATWFRAGARSRWLRVSADGARVEAMGADTIIGALREAGAGIRSGVLSIAAITPDPLREGVLAYDDHHRVLFAARPA
jgi:hypothetical protein